MRKLSAVASFFRHVQLLVGGAIAGGIVFTTASAQTTEDPARFTVVDCLLPGQVRKVGGAMTYLGPPRPVRATSSECEIRGGEFVAYDRANYATALQVWLPQAQEGNAQAQTHVGEIFEKGLGRAADYTQAAEWYQKAANQGFARAQSNLAYLYEKGLGVPQDSLKALNLYRQSAGISNDQLTFASEVTAVRQQAQSEIDDLSAKLEAQTEAASTLRKQLDDSRAQLSQRRAALNAARSDVERLSAELAQAKAAGPAVSEERRARVRELENELTQRESRVALQTRELNSLEKTTADRKAAFQRQLDTAIAQDEELGKRLGAQKSQASELVSVRSQLAAAQERQRATEERVAALNAQLQAERNALTQERARLAKQSAGTAGKQADIDKMKLLLQERETQLSQQSGVIAGLETQKQNYDRQVTELKTQQAARDRELQQKTSTIENVRAELASSQQRLLQTEERLADAKSILETERARVAQEREALERRRKAASAEQLKEIQNLAQELSKREALLIEQRAQIAALTAEQKEYENQIREQKTRVAMRSADGETAVSTPPPKLKATKQLQTGDYHALIIGNNNYQSMPNLETAINDARAVERVLRERYGFKTRVLLNANRGQIMAALNDLRLKLRERDNLLIYYAGHGELDARNLRGYWLPVNAKRDDTSEWISDQMITDVIGLMAARHVLVVADSCYSGAMTRSSLQRLVAQGGDSAELKRLTALAKLPSRTVLTSGGEAPVLDGGGGANSIFARVFVDALMRNEGVLEGAKLYNTIFDPVRRAAARFKVEQSPRYSMLADAGHLNGEFLFIPI